jgi:tripartite-type tricarboxylate transporter receptor subunit TctC
VVARKLAAKMADVLRQPVIIENKGGAGATIGTELVAKAPADGYTLLMATNSHTVNPYIYTKLSFNTAKDFAPVAAIPRPNTKAINSAVITLNTGGTITDT